MKSVLDSRQLLAARALADTGSFTLAGQKLSLTQSAVSHAIKALEDEVECQLFARTGKGVSLTPAGKQFLLYADRILAQMETARTLVAAPSIRGKERLRVGVNGWSRDNILPRVLADFRREFPGRQVVIESGDYVRNLELLDSGLQDLTFTVRSRIGPGLKFQLLFEDELRFIVAPGHPWARRGRPSFEDLAGNTLLLHPGTHNTAALLGEYFRQEKLALKHIVEMESLGALMAVVKTGLAVGVVSPLMIQEELNQGTLVALRTRSVVLQWGVVYREQRPLNAMEQRFIELYRQAVPGILGLPGSNPVKPPEKKEEAAALAATEPYLRFSGAAMLAFSAYNFLSDSIACGNWESALIAAS